MLLNGGHNVKMVDKLLDDMKISLEKIKITKVDETLYNLFDNMVNTNIALAAEIDDIIKNDKESKEKIHDLIYNKTNQGHQYLHDALQEIITKSPSLREKFKTFSYLI